MRLRDEAEARAFWDHVQRTTGARRAPWETFAAIFMTHMKQRYPREVALAPVKPSLGMVLRYAFDRGASARAAAGEDVQPIHLDLFLKRFGPMRTCLGKASRSLFDETGCLAPWFHGTMSRTEATRAINAWDANRRSNGRETHRPSPTVGAFLFRYSERQPLIALTYRLSVNDVKHCLVKNNGEDGYVLEEMEQVWSDLRQFVSEQARTFVHPVTSALHLECKEELEELEEEPSAPVEPPAELADPRTLYGKARAMACSDIGEGPEATGVLEDALSVVGTVVSRLRASEPHDLQLEAKSLRLQADILWKLRREQEGEEKYQRCLKVVKEAQEAQEVAHDGSPVVTSSILRHVHEVLATHYLKSRLDERSLYHFSELVACTTDEEERRELMEEFRQMREFQEATNNLNSRSVEEMLDEGISYFARNEFEPAGIKFQRALRDARCIGERRLEARALGNVATLDYKAKKIREAIPRYRMCVQLLRQLKDHGTERKILNYLVICCIEAKRWVLAKRFHDQLSQLAESEDNISLLRRLEARIEARIEEEGTDAEARAVARRPLNGT